jgi:hypothetical protein
VIVTTIDPSEPGGASGGAVCGRFVLVAVTISGVSGSEQHGAHHPPMLDAS